MAQVGIRGPFEIPYEEGTFVPVPHNLVIVGAALYWGFYKIIGNLLFFSILVVGDAAPDTTASTFLTTYFSGLPRDLGFWMGNINWATSMGVPHIALGNGYNANPDRVYPPTWAASHYVEINGFYWLSP